MEDRQILEIFRDPARRNYAFNLLVRKYQERLYWHIRKMVIDHDDTNDLLQNTFIKAYQALDRFKEESSLFTWLYRIATNEALGFLRSRKLRDIISLTSTEKQLAAKLESDAYFNGDEMQKLLQKAILQLPDKQRLVFNLRYYDEMPYEEMSRILKTSEGALKASYHHAMNKVEKFLKSQITG